MYLGDCSYQYKRGLVFQCTCVWLVSKSCPIPCDPMYCSPPGSSVHGIFQANVGVGCHFLVQGIFPTQGSNSLVGGFFTTESPGKGVLYLFNQLSISGHIQITLGGPEDKFLGLICFCGCIHKKNQVHAILTLSSGRDFWSSKKNVHIFG